MAIPSISTAVISRTREAFDFIINTFGKRCTLIYPTQKTPCPNCLINPNSQRSSNMYKPGGPTPFTNGLCPVCMGNYFLSLQNTEEVTLRCIFRDKELVLPDSNIPVRVPFGLLETRGFLTQVPQIQRAIELLAQLPIEGYKHQRYRRTTDFIENFSIIQNRYFSCAWEKVG